MKGYGLLVPLLLLTICDDNCGLTEEDVEWHCVCDRIIESGPQAGTDVLEIDVCNGPPELLAQAICEASVIYPVTCQDCMCEPTSYLCPFP